MLITWSSLHEHQVFLSSFVSVTQKIRWDFERKYVVSSSSKESAIPAVCALTLRKKLFGFDEVPVITVLCGFIVVFLLLMVLCDREKGISMVLTEWFWYYFYISVWYLYCVFVLLCCFVYTSHGVV